MSSGLLRCALWESLVRERVFKPLGLDGSFAWSKFLQLNLRGLQGHDTPVVKAGGERGAKTASDAVKAPVRQFATASQR